MHSSPSGSQNQLAQSRSPYLLQHASNPVDWREWGRDAFELAVERDVPIFLSIGYSTCHWCHVMAHESFEDEAIVAKMNAQFVNIKVDREERPDVDRIYMAFVQSLSGRGGWPMSVWLTPDLKPFYGGTYYPPHSRQGRIGFSELIDRIGELWKERRAELVEQGDKFVNTVGLETRTDDETREPLNREASVSCLDELAQQFDAEWGGFRGAPKFPMPSFLSFLLEMVEAEGADERKRRIIEITLDRMSAGGIHDFLAGGFHRYSVDRYWHVPHFEKMLYDQGQLASVYAEASRMMDCKDYLVTAMRIVDYVKDQLESPDGGIYSAEDADSSLPEDPRSSGEGAFYVWTSEELKHTLDEPVYSLFCSVFGVRPNGNVRPESDPHGEFKGKNVLMRSKSIEDAAGALGLELESAQTMICDALTHLCSMRAKRPRPHLDDKILASWNGLMISGACQVYQSSGRVDILNTAIGAGEFLASRLFDEAASVLYRSYCKSRGDTVGFAEDYASVALAFIDLYESTGCDQWLVLSERFLEILIDKFWDDKGRGFFATRSGDESLIVRMKDDYDGAEPSANSLAALALFKLGAILGNSRFNDLALQTIEAFRYQWSRVPRAMPLMLVALLRVQRPIQQIVMTGDRDTEAFQAFQMSIFKLRRRHSAIVYIGKDSDWLVAQNISLAAFDRLAEEPVVYVCENYTCKIPARNIEALEEQMAR